jgi:hypothetical protein
MLVLTTTDDAHKIKVVNLLATRQSAAPSFNGRTADSGSAYRGSNPWGAAKSNQSLISRIRPHGSTFEK